VKFRLEVSVLKIAFSEKYVINYRVIEYCKKWPYSVKWSSD